MLVLEGLFLSQPQLVNLQLPAQAGQQEGSAIGRVDCDPVLGASPLRLPTHPCFAFKGRLGNKQEVFSDGTSFRGLAGKAIEKAQTPSRGLPQGFPLKPPIVITSGRGTLSMIAPIMAVPSIS